MTPGRLADECQCYQPWIRLDSRQGDRPGQGFYGSEIACQPTRVAAGGIGVGFLLHLHNADHGQFLLAVVEED